MVSGKNQNRTKNSHHEEEIKRFADTVAGKAMDLFQSNNDADKTIRQLLKRLGRILEVSKMAVFEITEDGQTLMMSYDWEEGDAFGVQATNFTYVKDEWEDWVHTLPEAALDVCPDCEAEDAAPYQKKMQKWMRVRSYMVSVFFRDGEPAGSVFAGNANHAREWLPAEQDALAAVTKTLNVFLFNMRQIQRMEKESRLNQIIDAHQQFYSYILKDGTFEIMFLSNKVKELQPEVKPGDICYEVFMHREEPCEDCPVVTGKNGMTEKYNELINRWLSVSATRVDIGDGKRAVLVCNSDISEYKERMMESDPLTGLPTYAAFREKANELLQRDESKWALLYIDFDKFSEINAKRGMEAGNRVLQRYADFVRGQMKPGELVCRYFSDVFLLMVYCTDVECLAKAVAGAYEETEKWNKEYFPGMRLTMKTGIYQITGDEKDFDEAVEFAAAARAAIQPGGTYAVFDASMRNRAEKEARLEQAMADALESGEFAIYMQPKVELQTGATAGAEVLIRWNSEHGQIMPEEFIGLFEKNGFIQKLDVFMVERVFKMIRGWLDAGKRIVPVSMNISDDNVNDPAFIEKVRELVRKYSIPPYTIEIELRESMFAEHEEELRASVNQLRKLGVMFAIDDFGKGISSLNTIRTMPIDVLKLDKDMFDHLHISEQERTMLIHMIRMAKSLDMKVLCEGVETQEQEEMLKTTECDMAQGYLYGKPAPAEAFIKTLNA